MYIEAPKNKQNENSKNLLLLKKTFLKWLDNGNSLSELKTEENQKVIKGKLLDFMINTLDIDAWICELLDKENYYEVSYRFIERAK
ncbi:MAG: hypothetical protein JXQ23_10475, partial [Clostridia bacterium]|nr:hypothetical protein [Clostridia bacterium]